MFHLGWKMKSGNQSQADTCQRGNFSTPCAAHTMEFDHRSGQTRPHAFSTISWITFVQLHHPSTHDEDEVQFFPLRNFWKERTKNFHAFFLSFPFLFFLLLKNSSGTERNHPITVLTEGTRGNRYTEHLFPAVCVRRHSRPPHRINPNLTVSTYVSPGSDNLISWLRGVLKFKKPFLSWVEYEDNLEQPVMQCATTKRKEPRNK